MTPVTRETLDDLPVGTVVTVPIGLPLVLEEDGMWTDGKYRYTSAELIENGPVTVLLTPAQADAQTADAVRTARAQALRDAADQARHRRSDWLPNPFHWAAWMDERAFREEARRG